MLFAVIPPEGRAAESSLFRRSDLEEASEPKPRGRRDWLTRLLACSYYVRNVVLSEPGGRMVGRFWRQYPERKLVCDRLPPGVRVELVAWRGRLCRALGYRWIAFQHGAVVEPDRIREAAGMIEAAA